LYPPSLPHISLLILGVLSCTALNAYILTRCDRRLGVAAIFVFQIGCFVLLTSRLMSLAAVSDLQRTLYAQLELGSRVTAAVGGGIFAALLATQERERRHAAAIVGLLLATLALESALLAGIDGWNFQSAPAVFYLPIAAFVFLYRRRLFPELTRNVLDASVFDSQDAVVIFDHEGRYVESGTTGLEGIVSFQDVSGAADFLDRISGTLAGGSFFSMAELRSLPPSGALREITLRASGNARHYLVFANPVTAGPRFRLGFVLGFYDVTEQKELERELLERTAELTDANALLADSIAVTRRLEEEHARGSAAEEVHRVLGRRIEDLLAAMKDGAGIDELIARCRGVMADIRGTVAELSARRGAEGGAS
jgi:hypothetical protein